MAKGKYTVAQFRDMSEAERRVRRKEGEQRAVAEEKRNAKIWGKPAAAAAGLSGYKFKGKSK
jgi:hypothetical protein